MSKVKCQNEDCENQFTIGNHKKPGLWGECWQCGEQSEKQSGLPKLKGVMHYGHKTAGEIVIGRASMIDKVIKSSDRRGGQGILVGLAEQR